VYDVELVRDFCTCKIILAEPDEEKQQYLLDLLSAIVRENDEEIAVRWEFLKEKYAFVETDALR
jgi:hypothetical protein